MSKNKIFISHPRLAGKNTLARAIRLNTIAACDLMFEKCSLELIRMGFKDASKLLDTRKQKIMKGLFR